jgi:hypothetical protein
MREAAMRVNCYGCLLSAAVTLSAAAFTQPLRAQSASADAQTASAGVLASKPVTAPPGWRAYNRAAKLMEEGGHKFIHLDARLDDGVVWLRGSDFKEGTITVDIRGKDVQGESFVGIAFRGVDDTHYDAIYFRPFNFRTTDLARVMHAVQYISLPLFTWDKLRTDSPGKYEKPVSPVPDPSGWFRARVVIAGQAVNVYVNDSAQPSLTVSALSDPRSGMVGLYVGNGSAGDFANLKLIPERE